MPFAGSMNQAFTDYKKYFWGNVQSPDPFIVDTQRCHVSNFTLKEF